MNYRLLIYLIILLISTNYVLANSPPYFSNTTQTDFQLDEYSHLTYQINAIDPDNDKITYLFLTEWKNFNMNSGGLIDFTLSGGNEGNYNVLIIARDEYWNGNIIKLSFNILNVNEPPYINSFTPDTAMQLNENTVQVFNVNVIDPNNDTLSYKWYIDGALSSEANPFEYNFDYNSAGTHIVKALITDIKETISKNWTIEVSNVDRKPYLSTNIPDIEFKWNSNYEMNLLDYFKDDDNDKLTFSISTIENIDTAIDDNIITFTPKEDFYGSAEITFYAEDNKDSKIESNKIILTIKKGPKCGDNVCEADEDCDSCEQDCKCELDYTCKDFECIKIEKQEKIENITEEQTKEIPIITGAGIIDLIKTNKFMALVALAIVLIFGFLIYWFIFRKKKETYGF